MAQVIDAAGKSKGFSKGKLAPLVKVPNMRSLKNDDDGHNELLMGRAAKNEKDQVRPNLSSNQKEDLRDSWANLSSIPKSSYHSTAKQVDNAKQAPVWDDGTPGMLTGNELPRADARTPMSDAWRVSGSASNALADKEIEDTRAEIEQLDPRITMVGDTPENQAYLDYAAEKGGLSDEDVDMIRNHDELGSLWDRLWINSGIQDLNSNKDHIRKGEGYDEFITPDEYDSSLQNGSAEVIDDGTAYDYDHMTSRWMSGTQYLRYRDELGMGGRPGYIDPAGEYDKMVEANEYGFTPFLPDWWSLAGGVLSNVASVPQRLGAQMGTARERLTGGYTINYGDEYSVDGRDFDRNNIPYFHQVDYNLARDPTYNLRPMDGPVSAYTFEWTVPDANGNTSYHYGEWYDLQPEDYDPETGLITLRFSDGSSVTTDWSEISDPDTNTATLQPTFIYAGDAKGQLPDDLSTLNDVDRIMAEAESDGSDPIDHAWATFYPSMTMSDGTVLPYHVAVELAQDQSVDKDSDDDVISYDFNRFGPLDSRPSRFTNYDMFKTDDDGKLRLNLDDWTDFANVAADITTGSLPISLNRFWSPWTYSISSALPSMAGVNSQTYDPFTQSYTPIAGYYDDDGNLVYGVQEMLDDGSVAPNDDLSEQTRMWHALGTAAVPATEELAGPVGGGDLIGRIAGLGEYMPRNASFRRQIANGLYGPLAEGLEEVVGNHFDELTGYGPAGMWADQAVDAKGNPMYDLAGHEIRNYGTGMGTRLRNATNKEDVMNALSGGALVSEVMGARGIPRYLWNLNQARMRDNIDRRAGVSRYVPPVETETIEPSEKYLSEFDDIPVYLRRQQAARQGSTGNMTPEEE